MGNLIESSELSIDEVNSQLLLQLEKYPKAHVVGDVSDDFASDMEKAKIILKGNAGGNACANFKSSKITIYGSAGRYFGSNMMSSEAYIRNNLGDSSLENISGNSKVVIGGYVFGRLSELSGESTIIILNLQNADLKIDVSKVGNSSSVYVRGNDCCDSKFLTDTTYDDEDIYLPLISEFARQFDISLSEIKEKPFYKVARGEL